MFIDLDRWLFYLKFDISVTRIMVPSTELEVSTTFPFRENRRDGRTDGEGATLDATSCGGRAA